MGKQPNSRTPKAELEYRRFLFNRLFEHRTHEVNIVVYGRCVHNDDFDFASVPAAEVANVALECEDCGMVLVDHDNPDYEEK